MTDAPRGSSPSTRAAREKVAAALQQALPLLEALHSVTPMGDARRIIFKVIKQSRDALSEAPDGAQKPTVPVGQGLLESDPALFNILNNALGTMHYHRLMSALNWNGYRIVREGWQPIETAPKDGNPVIVWDDPSMGEAYHDITQQSWWWANTGRGDHTAEPIYPTLWRLMPEPPASAVLATRREGEAS